MALFLKTFNSIKSYANFNNVEIEKVGRSKYQAWHRKDHSTVAEARTLRELLNDIDDLANNNIDIPKSKSTIPQ
jgi:hypothetical protein